MNVLQTDYSNLFAAGLRVIESRSPGRGSFHPVDGVSSINVNWSASDEEVFTAPIDVAPKKSSRFPANLWRRVSWGKEKSPSTNDSVLACGSKPCLWRWRSMLPGSVGQVTPLDERVWDWSTSVYHATALPGEERDGEEYVDPHLDDKVDPVDTPLPMRATFLVALPSTAAPLWEHDFPVSLPSQHEQQHRRSFRTPQRRHPYSTPLKESTACQWELASASSHEESGIDDDWHQFRVEWIDFGVDGSR